MAKREFVVQVRWDADASVWWASSDDIPGLATEADTLEALVQNIREIAPELLRLNGVWAGNNELPIHVMAERLEKVRMPA
jgi:predicted RNase H-like HicB family nuclease